MLFSGLGTLASNGSRLGDENRTKAPLGTDHLERL